MDAKRRPPPIPEKIVAGMPPAKPPVPGPMPTPPNQLESQSLRKEDGEAIKQVPSKAEAGENHSGNNGANERFDPPVGGQFTSPAVALMDPMKKQARRKSNPPHGFPNQHQNALPPGAPPSQIPGASSGFAGKGGSAVASNGVQGVSDGIQQVQPASSHPQKHLRSPSVKRAPGATVTMQGWLHKQGSEGLMLWKRRWFVLSEFCLFYYKGPEEEKVLGSILLPSYIISPCSADEPKRGSQRKYSFKAEHHNMRTYYFAAESTESMERWMYNMNLASLLQRDFAPGAVSEGASWDERQSGRPSVSSFSSLLNQSADDSDSGFHGGRSPKHATIAVGSASSGQSAVVPMWATKGKKLEEETLSEISRERDATVNYRKGAETTPEVPSLPAEFQPLYANAPPKPRRLNSGGRDYSTSPERSPERKAAEDGVVLRSKAPANETQQNGIYVDRNQRTSRPTVSYASIRHERNSSYQQQNMQVQQQPIGIPAPNQVGIPMVDRRTPDTYGRSNTAETSTTAGIPKMVPNKVDYEDVYSVNQTSDQVMGRMNRWSSGPYETQHFYHTEIHHNTMPQQAPHVHLFPPSGHSPQQGLQQHTHSTPLGVVQRMPISHPYSVSPTTAQHQHPPLPQAQPQPHVNQQLMPPQPQPQMLHRRTPPLPRPHSADFLGHYDHNQMSYVMPLPANRTTPVEHPSPKISTAAEESKKPYKNVPSVEMRERRVTDVVPAQQIQRPKSSMDIRPMSQTLSFDPVDYWSEESYARMMRQSLYMHAHHVHPSSSSSHKGSETSSGMGHQQLQNWPPYIQEATPASTHQSAPRIPQISPKPQTIDPPSPYKGTEDMAATIPLRQSAPPGKRDLNQGGYFLRSASARMPRSRYHSGDSQRDQPNVLSTIPGDEEKNGEKKMQQREESMRRLLEWKQRMLQSPLTRKSSSSNSPRRQAQDSAPQNSSQLSSSHYKQMVLKQLANQEAQASSTSEQSTRRPNRRGPDDVRSARSRSHDGRRSSASLSRYNSYSSDDEASGSGSIREPAPIRHSKNDPSSTMLVISQPTSIPIQSPTYVQPPASRLGPPQFKQHASQPHVTEVDGEVEAKARQWRGNEGMVVPAAPMVRWERDNIPPIRKPEDPVITERDFHNMQRNMTSQKHDVPNGGGSRVRKGRESGDADKAGERKRVDGGRGEVSVSAGDLLGRTHEELVLLLIQLRRQSAAVSNAIDLCQADLTAQARLAELEMHRRVEHLKKLEELKKHLLELEKQYEKGKPLINLVDNMVKLGSLYRGNTDAQGRIKTWRGTGGEVNAGPSPAKDRLQFNQRVQEQRLLAEERRDWSRLSPDHGELQAKVQQLYRLDRLLQEESVTIQSLQQDKELLEKALGGLRHKLQGTGVPNIGSAGTTHRDLNSTKGMVGSTPTVDPVEAERYRKQQRMLERELSRVRQLLAQNSKKLEETVAENARLEQELVVLRQKLQLSRRTIDNHSTTQSPGSASTNPASPSGATASLEAELRRVQSAVGDLQRQRQELSVQVRQLTEKSHSLVEQIRPGPTGVAAITWEPIESAGPIPAKKRHHSTWMVTDLDSMESVDCGIESPGGGPSPSRGVPILQPMVHAPTESTPLYVNTALGQHVEREDGNRKAAGEEQPSMPNGYEMGEGEAAEVQGYQAMDINEADDRMKRFYGIIPREKPEIKTVRIVKRESERRHRDRSSKRVVLVDDPSENPSSTSSLNRVLEEEAVEGEEEEEAMAYHAHQQQSSQLHNMSSSVPFSSGFLGPPEEDPILSQFFQRSLSLPRALGKQRGQPPPVPPPPPLRVASPRGSTAAVKRQQLRLRSDVSERPRSAHEQLFGTTQEDPPCLQQPSLSYSMLPSYSSSPSSHSNSPTLFAPTDRPYPPLPPTPDSPPPIAYKSEAAREIALEMAALHSGDNWANGDRDSVKKRATPKEKRRHYTVSCSRPLELESIVLPKMGSARSRDDLDMEQVLRPRLNAPDVVRSTMSHRDFKYNEHTIDSVLGTPNKIVIPERYIPEQAPELSEEEQMHRLKKAEAIRKMLSETTPITAPEVEDNPQKKTSIIKKKVAEEKRQRDHILQLNQILAKQVMEKSKMVAGTTPVAEFGTQD